HPEAYRAWLELIRAIRGQMDLRRCELATVAAARALKSTACTVAHSKMLRDRFYETEQVIQIATDHRHAGLDDVDVAVMDFAERVAERPSEIRRGEVESLKSLGLSDRDVLDVVLSVAARAFFTTIVDALDSPLEEELIEDLEPELLEVLVVGRPLRPT
ncbi:MAG TPA: carboxymuconolactone decarboxylase family protein, partial [Acidimicrobiia bacterium]|nr:carboxymuconolactone decarboxylase family protein [Acidimicrobiia bacterium]